MKTKLLLIAAFGLFASSTWAGVEPSVQTVPLPSVKVFGEEVQVDLHETYLREGEADWGYGARLNYFFNETVGLGAEFSYLGDESPWRYSAGLNLFFRSGIEDLKLAPYILVGAGYTFDGLNDIYVKTGAGLDYRFSPNWGIYVEGVGQWIYDYDGVIPMISGGVRFTF